MNTNIQTRRKRRSVPTMTDRFDTLLDDAIVLADMRERVRLFGTTPFRFA